MSAPPLRLYLVRHGETAWTVSGQHTGLTDIPLSAHVGSQARALAPWLASLRFGHVLTSPRVPARRTCDLASYAMAAIDEDLAEWNYGDYEGLLTADIAKDRPDRNLFRDGCPPWRDSGGFRSPRDSVAFGVGLARR